MNQRLKNLNGSTSFLKASGINGFQEGRPVWITPLDYFQTRILGDDLRFQCNDYLFYALSMHEYNLIKSNISLCGPNIQHHNSNVDDVHLYVKKLCGSSAYWRTARNESIAQIRCLGPPHYFITFSCNDLNRLDMRKALLLMAMLKEIRQAWQSMRRKSWSKSIQQSSADI